MFVWPHVETVIMVHLLSIIVAFMKAVKSVQSIFVLLELVLGSVYRDANV
jgi:hypothetical protein